MSEYFSNNFGTHHTYDPYHAQLLDGKNCNLFDDKWLSNHENKMQMMNSLNASHSIGINTFSDEIAQENYDLRIENAKLKRSVKILTIANVMSFISVVGMFCVVMFK